jgi:hypothetical protein
MALRDIEIVPILRIKKKKYLSRPVFYIYISEKFSTDSVRTVRYLYVWRKKRIEKSLPDKGTAQYLVVFLWVLNNRAELHGRIMKPLPDPQHWILERKIALGIIPSIHLPVL